MKKWIKKWLGIDKTEADLAQIRSTLVIGGISIEAREQIIFIGQIETAKVVLSQTGGKAELTMRVSASDVLTALAKRDGRSM